MRKKTDLIWPISKLKTILCSASRFYVRRVQCIALPLLIALNCFLTSKAIELGLQKAYAPDLLAEICPNPIAGLNLSCHPLELHKFVKWQPRQRYSDGELTELIEKDCSKFVKMFCFPTLPLSVEERDYSLAFTMLAHENAENVIRIFRSLFWPQNAYCLALDSKSAHAFKRAIHAFASCLNKNVKKPNIVFPATETSIAWGDSSILKATLLCMEKLTQMRENGDFLWKYHQYLTGMDFPLRTNHEMVRIFKRMNGANDIELRRDEPIRRAYAIARIEEQRPGFYNAAITAGAVKKPFTEGLRWYRGINAIALTAETVHWLVNSNTSKSMLQYLDGTFLPEETFFATLLQNEQLQAPGHFPGRCLGKYAGKKRKPWFSRYSIVNVEQSGTRRCQSRYWLQALCVFGVLDLPDLYKRPHLIAHKLTVSFQPATQYCLTYSHWQRTYGQWTQPRLSIRVNLNHTYGALPGVKLLEFEQRYLSELTTRENLYQKFLSFKGCGQGVEPNE